MKWYIAASFPCKDKAIGVGVRLKDMGQDVVARWLTHSSNDDYNTKIARQQLAGEYATPKGLREGAILDFEDVTECDAVVVLTDGEKQLTRGGRHTEVGIALAQLKRIYLVGPTEQVFHFHPLVQHYATLDDFFSDVGLIGKQEIEEENRTTRQVLGRGEITKAIQFFHSVVEETLKKKGRGIFNTRHEVAGVMMEEWEEFKDEIGGEIGLIKAELEDLVGVGIFAWASIVSEGMEW